ncbi:endo-1,4-beta-xylanase [Sinomicrobium kalidii]|uniref:endo-1,4-beta-xylanase n=1 Tax=Sinomicrobium kalidii TaxID=2900738 RepID=UPI001E3C9545|nr:endo-1,4-beta-xylanase [Sinomicrobium kalidii]UGU15867.1 endo-1,4-beta-xylanase [Sinomicrobium kalidii]
MKTLIALWLLILMGSTACTEEETVVFVDGDELNRKPDAELPDVSLKEKATFNIGAAVKAGYIENEAAYSQALSGNFNQLTAEFEMKMEVIWSAPHSYNWEKADDLVGYAESNNMDVHGHALVWYRSFPEWFGQAEYDSTAFENHVKKYITDVVGHYKGKVKSWDVVNEVFADGGGLRNEDIIKPVFNDPIAFYGRCFQYARNADPDARLFYNDYSVVTDSGKRDAIKAMIDRFAAEGYPIDGVGDQFHYMQSTDKTTMQNGFTDLAGTGLLIHISELDIRMNLQQSESYVFTGTEAEKQADTYRFIVEMYENLPDTQKFAITTWGVTDKYTWITDYWHENEYPLLLDETYAKKPAYYGFLEGLE